MFYNWLKFEMQQDNDDFVYQMFISGKKYHEFYVVFPVLFNTEPLEYYV